MDACYMYMYLWFAVDYEHALKAGGAAAGAAAAAADDAYHHQHHR